MTRARRCLRSSNSNRSGWRDSNPRPRASKIRSGFETSYPYQDKTARQRHFFVSWCSLVEGAVVPLQGCGWDVQERRNVRHCGGRPRGSPGHRAACAPASRRSTGDIEANSKETCARHLTLHVIPYIGKQRVAEVSRETIHRLLTVVLKEGAPGRSEGRGRHIGDTRRRCLELESLPSVTRDAASRKARLS